MTTRKAEKGKKTQGRLVRGRGLTELIGRALTDKEFRGQLFDDRSRAIADYRLSDTDLAALEDLKREDLEQHADKLSAGRKVPVTVKVQVTKHF